MSPRSRPRPRPAHPPGLHALPDTLLHRILSHVARQPPNLPPTHLPHLLLPLAATSRRLRSVVSSFATLLPFEPHASWRTCSAYIRLSAHNLRVIRLHPQLRPLSDDAALRPRDLLPATFVLSALIRLAPPLRVLDLSGLNLDTDHDTDLLATLLLSIRFSLTQLTLLDSSAYFRGIVHAFATARLYHLTHLTFIDLRPDCDNHLTDILTSLQPAPNIPVALSSLHLDLAESRTAPTFSSTLLYPLCPNLTSLTFASAFESPHLVPHRFIHPFHRLHALSLKDMILEPEQLALLLPQLPALRTLCLHGCLILGDMDGQDLSHEFLQLITSSAHVLTALWLPSRVFSDLELLHVAKYCTRIEELALTLADGAAATLPTLCQALCHSLTTLRLSGHTNGDFRDEPPQVQMQLLQAIKAASRLSNIQFYYMFLSTESWKTMLGLVGSRLTDFYVEFNPNDAAETHFETLIAMLDHAARYCRSLRSFSVDVECRPELPASAPLVQSLVDSVKKILSAAPFLCPSDLSVLLTLWVESSEKEIVEDALL